MMHICVTCCMWGPRLGGCQFLGRLLCYWILPAWFPTGRNGCHCPGNSFPPRSGCTLGPTSPGTRRLCTKRLQAQTQNMMGWQMGFLTSRVLLGGKRIRMLVHVHFIFSAFITAIGINLCSCAEKQTLEEVKKVLMQHRTNLLPVMSNNWSHRISELFNKLYFLLPAPLIWP